MDKHYVAEIWSMDSWGERRVTRVSDADQAMFYAKVTGSVKGITRAGSVITSLDTIREGE